MGRAWTRGELRAYLSRRTRDRRIVAEGRRILGQIARGPHPLVVTKQGGYTACYYPDAHAIALRENSWRRMGRAQRRLTVVHEWVHACGVGHSSLRGFEGPTDLLSLVLYRRIWGRDAALRELFVTLERAAREIRPGARPALSVPVRRRKPTCRETSAG